MTATARRFTIADGMILVAAAAVATVLSRDYVASTYTVYRTMAVDRLLTVVEGPTTCIASAVLLALIPIRLRRPRPGLRRLVRQPGFAASCATAAALTVGLVQGANLVAFRTVSPRWGTWPFQQLWTIGAGPCPSAIAGAWLILALNGRWRAERGWIDRTGRIAAAVWIFWFLIYLLETWLFRLLPAL